jgi:hypothetical protein
MASRKLFDFEGSAIAPTSPIDVSFSRNRRSSIISTSSSNTFDWPLESFNAFTRRASTSSMSLLGLGGNAPGVSRDETNKVVHSMTDALRDIFVDASVMHTRVADNAQKQTVQLIRDRRTMRSLKSQVQLSRDDVAEAAEIIEQMERGDVFAKLLDAVNQCTRTLQEDKMKKKSGS